MYWRPLMDHNVFVSIKHAVSHYLKSLLFFFSEKCIFVYTRGSHKMVNTAIIPDGASFFEACMCTGPSSEPIRWTINNQKLPDDYGDIQSVVNGPWSKTSFFNVSNITTAQQGDICCNQTSSSTACVTIQVAKLTRNLTLFVMLKNFTLADEGDGTVVVECTVIAFSKLSYRDGYMALSVNGVSDIVTFGFNPQSKSYKDRNGMTVWTITYVFLKRVENGDEMECVWTHEDILERLKAKLTVDFSSLEIPVNRTANNQGTAREVTLFNLHYTSGFLFAETDSSPSTFAGIVTGSAGAGAIAFVAVYISLRKSCRPKCRSAMKYSEQEAVRDWPQDDSKGKKY